MRFTILTVFLFIYSNIFSNDSLIISKLLERIDELQVKENGVFPKGSIPSYRMYAWNKTRHKADINVFFTAVTGLTLQDMMKELSVPQQELAKTIISRTMSVYPKFRNRKHGWDTYNFWPTDTPKIFPNSYWLNFLDKKKAIPDDLDDTVLVLLAQNASDSIAKIVHTLMQRFTNRPEKQIRNTYKAYKNIWAYETWFGKKMPTDFDIGLFANVLLFVQKYELAWTKTDSATLSLMVKMLKDRKHITAPNYIAPHYASTSVILYHVSRLMAVKPIPELEELKSQLIDDAKDRLTTADNFFDQIMLSTSLLRWDVSPPDITYHQVNNISDLVENDEGTPFFIANIAHMFPNPLKEWVNATGIIRFSYFSPAYNNVLMLENLIWRKRRGISTPKL